MGEAEDTGEEEWEEREEGRQRVTSRTDVLSIVYSVCVNSPLF